MTNIFRVLLGVECPNLQNTVVHTVFIAESISKSIFIILLVKAPRSLFEAKKEKISTSSDSFEHYHKQARIHKFKFYQRIQTFFILLEIPWRLILSFSNWTFKVHIDRALQSSVCTCNLCVLGRIKRVDSRLEFGVRHLNPRTYISDSTVEYQ